MPANDTYQPASTTRAAACSSPAKQWNTTLGGAPSPSRMATHVGEGLAAMDDQGLVELAGQADVGGEGGPLGVPGRVVVVVVQPRLPHPDHPLVGQQPAQLLQGGPGEAVGVVGVDPGGGRHLGQPGGVGGGLPAGGQVDPDVDQVPDPLGGRLGHHLLGRGLQQVQVAVGVDQHAAEHATAPAPAVAAATAKMR